MFYNFDGSIEVFPNPSHGLITIRNLSDKTLKIVLTDLSGKIVFSKATVEEGEHSLDLQNLPKSMYIIEIFDEYYSHKEKLMILE